MARRHIMTLRVGSEFVVVETLPAPPTGYQVTVSRSPYGEAPRLIFDEVRPTTKAAAALFKEQCFAVLKELIEIQVAGVIQRPSRIVSIMEDEDV